MWASYQVVFQVHKLENIDRYLYDIDDEAEDLIGKDDYSGRIDDETYISDEETHFSADGE